MSTSPFIDAYNRSLANEQPQQIGSDQAIDPDAPEIQGYWDLIESCAATPEMIPKPGEWTAIDCGANIGEISLSFLEHGAKVYAFEPNNVAYTILEERLKDHPWIVTYNKAVSDKYGTTKLYLHKKLQGQRIHENETDDEVYRHIKYSQGCSLKSDKRNVDEENYQEIETVRLCDFIKKLQDHPEVPPILILKIDVEGAEVDLLRDLLDTGIAEQIPFIFVETHDQKVPSIADEMAKIRKRIDDGKENGQYHNIFLNWL